MNMTFAIHYIVIIIHLFWVTTKSKVLLHTKMWICLSVIWLYAAQNNILCRGKGVIPMPCDVESRVGAGPHAATLLRCWVCLLYATFYYSWKTIFNSMNNNDSYLKLRSTISTHRSHQEHIDLQGRWGPEPVTEVNIRKYLNGRLRALGQRRLVVWSAVPWLMVNVFLWASFFVAGWITAYVTSECCLCVCHFWNGSVPPLLVFIITFSTCYELAKSIEIQKYFETRSTIIMYV